MSQRNNRIHPCKGCSGESLFRGQMKLCPRLNGFRLRLEGCNRISGKTPKKAWEKIDEVNLKIQQDIAEGWREKTPPYSMKTGALLR